MLVGFQSPSWCSGLFGWLAGDDDDNDVNSHGKDLLALPVS